MKKIALLVLVFVLSANVVLGADQFSSTISYGSKNKIEVKKLQEFLASEGLFTVSPTGTFGAVTLKAVKAFQKRESIPTTGFFGIKTKQRANEIFTQKEISNTISTPTVATITQVPAQPVVTPTTPTQNSYVPIVIDLCTNIEGVQTYIPYGMSVISGVCAYPQQSAPITQPTTNTTTTPSVSTQTSTNTQQNQSTTPTLPTVPMVISPNPSIGSLTSGQNSIAKQISISNTNTSLSLYWKRIAFTVMTQGHVGATDFALYNSSNTLVPATVSVINSSGDIGTTSAASTAQVIVTANSEQELASGTNTDYTLRANIQTSPDQMNALAVTLNPTSLSSASNYASINSTSSFVWTDRSASSHSENSNDWYSGLSGNYSYSIR